MTPYNDKERRQVSKFADGLRLTAFNHASTACSRFNICSLALFPRSTPAQAQGQRSRQYPEHSLWAAQDFYLTACATAMSTCLQCRCVKVNRGAACTHQCFWVEPVSWLSMNVTARDGHHPISPGGLPAQWGTHRVALRYDYWYEGVRRFLFTFTRHCQWHLHGKSYL